MTSFSVTWDYRCPFARNLNEHILTAMEGGADWDVYFAPFSLGQAHVEEGETSVWDEPAKDSGLLALQAGVWVRDNMPEDFLRVHRALFSARHDQGALLQKREVLEGVLSSAGVDTAAVFAAIDSGDLLSQVQAEHEKAANEHDVWGVPTLISGPYAAFVRLMNRSQPGSDADAARASIEHLVGMLADWPDLNEFKHTSVRR